MGAKVAATCLHSSQPVVSHSSSLSQKALASSALSPSSSSSNSYSFSRRSRRGRSVSDRAAAAALLRFARSPPHPPLFFGINLPRSRSCEFSSYSYSRSSRSQSLWRSCSSRGSDAFFDEEFAGSLRETTDDGDAELENASSSNPKSSSSIDGMEGKDGFAMMYNRNHNSDFPHNSNNNLRLSSSSNNSYSNSPSSRRAFGSEAVAEEGEMISASVEHKANSVDFPLSLRMLKRKKKQRQEWEEGEGLFGESSASASSSAAAGAGSCSVKKAFSSMVFMIRELHTYTLHMREMVFPHHQLGMGMGMGMGMDLQGVLARVRKEMHASFVWLFQHIFSSTPTLMVYVMILLANFTVYSMTATAAIAPPPRPTMEATTAASESHHHHHQQQQRFDPLSTIKGRTASVGGSGGGGGKVRPMAGATDGGGDGRFEDSFDQHRTMFRDEMSSSSRATSLGNGNPAAAVSQEKGEEKEEELKLWNSIVEEASRMQGDVYLDHDTMHRLVSPVTVVMEPEDYTHYLWTDLLYQRAVSEEPDNPLILSNYAQFLYLVVHDLDRAEEMFKRAVGVGPPDADSLSRYASFLWVARNDLAGAEEKFLEAIEADPTNTIHAANYAHFLWNTGGEDTCYPLTS
ncbi:hypothetical protein AAC387_Pa05g3899 [Persea americana]